MKDRDNRVVKVEGFELCCTLPELAGNALRVFNQRSALLVKVTTAGGIAGWGETWAFPTSASSFIRTTLAPAILGADVTNPRAAQARLLQFAVPDRRGQAHMAISALDIAFWDGYGHVEGKPIHALLGGRLRDRVTAYASGPLLKSGVDRYAGFAEEVERYAEAGYRAVKVRVGVGAALDVQAIRRARAVLGDDALLMADLNESSTQRGAVALTEAVADARLAWIEEPLPHDDLPGYTRLARALAIPLAGGESFCGVQAFRDSLCAGALDIIQPDLALCGGLTEGMRIAGLAGAFDVPVAPHVWGTGINTLAALQFASVLPSSRGSVPFPLLECDMGFNPLRTAIFDPKPDAEGHLAVPGGPGLGVEVAIDRIAEYVTAHWVLE
ncbi:D-galactarolactone cycloisomerase [Mesorhizobium tianshanense]|uniref:D-galactarolactone cycloisomerase n=1 Tax=Mesorhizobium tianshanense TaxID=39844 RepID=A0A562P1T7_9HYPH|nr:mandelate racemase/muconate lactonizing enzyme family protein [Mesorhizobium tianshanense]TWI38437.1 D-galactarolactone cycloisomerase [Mesorhizobium tianshanense]GLS38587.1 D-galactarolactone cycloisomerase [Mesorhizobium tianshanense]